MQIGFGLPVSGAWATPEHQREVATRAEQLGYATLWSFQRLLFPVPAEGVEPLAPAYHSVDDPLVPLGYVAALTERIRLGVAIVNLPFYAPVVLAKMLTAVDRVSAGRLDAGLGLGWSPEEFASAGVPIERRGARAEEFLRLLKTIWTSEVAEFSGDFYQLPAARIDPKPVQRPHPPILLGGTAPAALRRAGRVADGWISSSRADPRTLGESVRTVRAAAERAGRDPDTLRFICRGVRLRPADLDLIAEQGMTETFIDLNFDPAVGNPQVPATAAMERARSALAEFAPHPT